MTVCKLVNILPAPGPNPWKVVLMVEELRVPYTIHSFKFDDVKKPPFIDVNPNVRVPGVYPNSVTVKYRTLLTMGKQNLSRTQTQTWRSGNPGHNPVSRRSVRQGEEVDVRISEWEAATESMASLSNEWSRSLLWAMWLVSHVATRENTFFFLPRTEKSQNWTVEYCKFSALHPEKIPSAIDRYKNEIQRILGVLNTALEGKDWLVGDKCTFADVSFLQWNCRLDALLQTPPEVDPLEAFPNVQKWHQRMVSRDAWKRAMEIRDKLMDEQGLQSNGMPKGITNIKEYEELIAKHAAAAAAEAA